MLFVRGVIENVLVMNSDSPVQTVRPCVRVRARGWRRYIAGVRYPGERSRGHAKGAEVYTRDEFTEEAESAISYQRL